MCYRNYRNYDKLNYDYVLSTCTHNSFRSRGGSSDVKRRAKTYCPLTVDRLAKCKVAPLEPAPPCSSLKSYQRYHPKPPVLHEIGHRERHQHR